MSPQKGRRNPGAPPALGEGRAFREDRSPSAPQRTGLGPPRQPELPPQGPSRHPVLPLPTAASQAAPCAAAQFGDVSFPQLTSRLYYSHLKEKTSSCNSEIINSDSKNKLPSDWQAHWALKDAVADLKEARQASSYVPCSREAQAEETMADGLPGGCGCKGQGCRKGSGAGALLL